MVGRFALVLACTCASVQLSRGTALQEEMDASIPLDAWEASSCSTGAGSEGDCPLHLLQLRAQGLTDGVDSTEGASVQAEDPVVHDTSIAQGPTADLKTSGGASVQAEDSVVHGMSSGPGPQNVSAYSSGACTAQDHARFSAMGGGHTPGSFPHNVALCADKALKWFVFHRDIMTRCVSESLGVSMSCAACYSYIGQYGYSHCKAQCVFSKWCGDGCLTCTKRSYPEVDKCAGFTAPFPTVC